jgi:nuclear pore complex protein Nup155
MSANDGRAEYYERRLRCYDLAIDSLAVFEERSTKPMSLASGVGENSDNPDAVCSYAYQLALGTEDEMFHASFYDWLISKGLADQLLEVCLPFIPFKLHHPKGCIRCGPRS